jgi:glucose/arabinose dehydrogenase
MEHSSRSSFFSGATLAGLLAALTAVGCDGNGDTGQGGTAGKDTGGSGGTATGGTAGTGGAGGSGGTVVPVDHDCSAPDGAPPALQLTEVASGFERPILLKAAPGDNERLFVVEQTGKVWIVQGGQKSAEPFLDIQSLVANPDAADGYHQEQGLLGLAFHPEYAQNGRFFVHYSEGPFSNQNPTGDTRIVEYKRSDDPNKASPDAVKTIFSLEQPYTNHNGGSIEFSPKDGFLYIGMGDGGAGGDPLGSGQDASSLLGKILRIDVGSGDPYGIPPGNMAGAAPEVWSIGWRNPWRFSFDLCTGDMYVGDVGQDQWEEVDIEKAGEGGKNYGWNTMEGTHCFEPQNGCDQTGLVLPVTEYDHITGKSITGGYVYRGKNIPGLRGTYFYADFVSPRLWMFRWDGGASVNPTEITGEISPPEAMSSFGQDNFGEMYVVSMYGVVYRIDAK